MKTLMQKTSLTAFDSIQKSLGRRQQEVLDMINIYGPQTDEELKHHLGWEINRITGRRNDLYKDGIIQPKGTKKSSTGRTVIIWGLSDKSGQTCLF